MSDGVIRPEFTDEAKAEKWLVECRWPGGVHCPFCYCTRVRRKDTYRMPFRCRCCGKHFSVTSETALHGSNLSYVQLVMGFSLMAVDENATEADLKRLDELLGTSRKAAWSLVNKIKESWHEGA